MHPTILYLKSSHFQDLCQTLHFWLHLLLRKSDSMRHFARNTLRVSSISDWAVPLHTLSPLTSPPSSLYSPDIELQAESIFGTVKLPSHWQRYEYKKNSQRLSPFVWSRSRKKHRGSSVIWECSTYVTHQLFRRSAVAGASTGSVPKYGSTKSFCKSHQI